MHLTSSNANLNPPSRNTVIVEWVDVLTHSARDAINRMDTTLTLAEAKVALLRQLLARRREWETEQRA